MINKASVYIAGCAAWLPLHRTPSWKAIVEDFYRLSDLEKSEYESISIADKDIYPADMAVFSAKNALQQAGISGSELNIIIYNSIHRHGNPQLWCPASYLQKILGAQNSLPLTINQGCNSQLLSIEASIKMLRNSSEDYALITASDKFSGSGFNRWQADYSIVYGDAAASVVLSKKPGLAKIIDIQTYSDPDLEELHRFKDEYDENINNELNHRYNVKAAKDCFMNQYGKESITTSTKTAMLKLLDTTFNSQKISIDTIKYYIFPNLGNNILSSNYYPNFPNAREKSLWEFGNKIGHLGAADCIAGLSHLISNNHLKNGDRILCIGAGAGFSWTFMVIEIV
jgi:3-oxoacyl-[acyl-carrier-protein] synthase III